MSVWDKPLSGNTGDFPILPPGVYEFTVEGAGRAEYKPKPGAKYGPCAMIKLTLVVEGKDSKGRERVVKVFDNLFSDPQAEWKMIGFAKSTGIWHEEMTPADVMQRATGMTGTVQLRVGEWQGRKRNEVERYIVPETDPDDETEIEVTNDDLPF